MSLNPNLNKRIRAVSDEGAPIFKKLHTVMGAQQDEPIAEFYSMIDGLDHQSIAYKECFIIGRSRQCDLRLMGNDISTKHCQLIPVYNEATGQVYLNIVDSSTNGTFVNGTRLSDNNQLLKDGDKVHFAKSASYVFRYKRNLHMEGTSTQDKENIPLMKKSKSESPQLTFKDVFSMGKQLGSGHYATVNEAFNRKTGQNVAVKVFKPQRLDDAKSSKQFNQELSVLMSIRHPNIVELIDRFIEPINKHQVTTYLVLEKVQDGELFTRIVNKQRLRENECKAIFKQILQGLQYLHERDIIHRDIKPENILLNITRRTNPDQIQTGPWDQDEINVEVKIADFGLAKFIGEHEFTNTLCGTPAYVAPEVLKSTRMYSKNVDLWSSGVLLYVCLVGFPPFSDELGPPSMREQILEGKYAFYSPYFDDIDDLALDFISKLLMVDPGRRLDIHQAIDHPWFQDSRTQQRVVTVQRSPVKGKLPKTYTEVSMMSMEEDSD